MGDSIVNPDTLCSPEVSLRGIPAFPHDLFEILSPAFHVTACDPDPSPTYSLHVLFLEIPELESDSYVFPPPRLVHLPQPHGPGTGAFRFPHSFLQRMSGL